MKYIIIGMHSSGKNDVINILKNNDIRCGKLFTNLDDIATSNIYNICNYENYSTKEINEIFENNAYVFLQEFQFGDNSCPLTSAYKYYEGLSLYEFENNDVFVISPDQLFAINPTSIKEDITFIWMDNTRKSRMNRYHFEKRQYNFHDRENIESKDSNSFVKFLYGFENSNVMYFTEEDPGRIAAILYSVIKHPDLLPMYIQSFN